MSVERAPFRRHAGGRNADQAVQLRDAQRLRIFDRAADAVAELGNAIGQARDAAFAGFPMAGRQVVQDETQAVRLEPFGQFGGGERIREQEFDCGKSCACRRLETVEERHFVEQHGQVGCEFRHVAVTFRSVKVPTSTAEAVHVGSFDVVG